MREALADWFNIIASASREALADWLTRIAVAGREALADWVADSTDSMHAHQSFSCTAPKA